MGFHSTLLLDDYSATLLLPYHHNTLRLYYYTTTLLYYYTRLPSGEADAAVRQASVIEQKRDARPQLELDPVRVQRPL